MLEKKSKGGETDVGAGGEEEPIGKK